MIDPLTEPIRHQWREWGVQVGTWPPTIYQSEDSAAWHAKHPSAYEREYRHSVVTRLVQVTDWVPARESARDE